MDLDEYACLLGKVIANLQSLEFVLRAYLYARGDGSHTPLPSGSAVFDLQEGDAVVENAFTDYSTLGKLIERYNRLIATSHPELTIDDTIVVVRDALAHGRVARAPAPDRTADGLVLMKFERPTNGQTVVTHRQSLTREWLVGQVARVAAETKKVMAAPGSPVES